MGFKPRRRHRWESNSTIGPPGRNHMQCAHCGLRRRWVAQSPKAILGDLGRTSYRLGYSTDPKTENSADFKISETVPPCTGSGERAPNATT